MLPDGLYRVSTSYLCAGFVVDGGKVTDCAPILRKKLSYWMTVAQRVPETPPHNQPSVDSRPPGGPTDQSKNQAMTVNDNLVLVVGKSATGKSASLMGLNNAPNAEGVMYLNCEAGKKLPFRAKFKQYVITDPLQIFEAFDAAEQKPEVHTIVIDTLTYLLDMYESLYVINSANTMKAWGDFSQYFKTLMQDKVAKSTKNVIFLAHSADSLNENEMAVETKVPVKGSLKNNGIESYFSLVIASKKVPLKVLKDYSSSLLNITPEEEVLGFKYVFQTKLTKDTVNERLRGPLGLFDTKETFMDNDVQLVLNRLHSYYA